MADDQVEHHLLGANDWEVRIASVDPKSRSLKKKDSN